MSRSGYKKIILCSGHGGNNDFLNFLIQTCLEKNLDYVLYYPKCLSLTDEQYHWLQDKYGEIPPGGHADYNETSSIMAIRPDLVCMDQMRPEESRGTGKVDWYYNHNVNTGINWYATHPWHFAGDPTGASAEYGEDLLNFQAQNLAEIVKYIKNDDLIPEQFAEFYSQTDHPAI